MKRGAKPSVVKTFARVTGGRVVQRQVLYLGEINDSQCESWRKTIEVFEEGSPSVKTMALFPEDRRVEIDNQQVVQIRLKDVKLRRPRQWGGCWLACTLYEQLGLNTLFRLRRSASRQPCDCSQFPLMEAAYDGIVQNHLYSAARTCNQLED